MVLRLKIMLAFAATAVRTQMLQVSRDLGRQAEQLRHTVENFLRQVAAADQLKRAS